MPAIGDREAAEARALHLIGELVGDYPGISDPDVAAQVSHVLHTTAIELISKGLHSCLRPGGEARPGLPSVIKAHWEWFPVFNRT
ncbi:hypothetical protein ACOZ38_28970 [Sphaerisporangium viridialbum]|uniref:hypothetical protein n=1 Tax=Sphaerisporangium viridialbum TaxID=46189 RepID=UPI003C735312